MGKGALAFRGLLLHVSHYDPAWCRTKRRERPFDPDVGLDVVAAMADAGMNLLIVDCADGVAYQGHPELERPYTAPMKSLATLCQAAHERGIDVVPKLNFAKSGRNLHDMWMRPHWDPISWLKDLDTYWQVAGDLIGELVAVCRPRRFFHIGMDEDHYRSVRQYVAAIKTLRKMIRACGLRTVIWNDSCHDSMGAVAQVHADKCRAAEDLLPHDVVHTLWDYVRAHPGIAKRVVGKGFTLWGAPGPCSENVRQWRRALLSAGGTGMIMTCWKKCNRRHRAELLRLVNKLGPEYA